MGATIETDFVAATGDGFIGDKREGAGSSDAFLFTPIISQFGPVLVYLFSSLERSYFCPFLFRVYSQGQSFVFPNLPWLWQYLLLLYPLTECVWSIVLSAPLF